MIALVIIFLLVSIKTKHEQVSKLRFYMFAALP